MTKTAATLAMGQQTNLGRQTAALGSAIFDSAHCPCCFGFAAWCVPGSLERDGDGLLERSWFELADGRPEFDPAIGIGLAAGPLTTICCGLDEGI